MSRGTFASIIAAVTFVLFFVLVVPQYDAIKLFRETLASREALLAERSRIIENIRELERQVEARQADLDRLGSFIPRSKQIDEIVSSIENLAGSAGLQLISITTSGATDAANYKKLFISPDLIGTYPNLVNFLKLAEQSLRLYDVFELTLSPATALAGNNLNISLKMHAHYLE